MKINSVRKQASFSVVYKIVKQELTLMKKKFLPCFNTVVSDQFDPMPLPFEKELPLIYLFDELRISPEVEVSIYQKKGKQLTAYFLNDEEMIRLGLFPPFAHTENATNFTLHYSQVLIHILQSQRAYLKNIKDECILLKWSKPKTILFDWVFHEHGVQYLEHKAPKSIGFFASNPPIYFNHQTGVCGFMQTNVPHTYLCNYMNAVGYEPSLLKKLTAICKKNDLPLPKRMEAILTKTPKIIPGIRLSFEISQGEIVPVVELSFNYGRHKVDAFHIEDKVYYLSKQQWYYFKRNQQQELMYMQQLDEQPFYFYHHYMDDAQLQASSYPNDSNVWQKHLHLLQSSGWQITIEECFPLLLPDWNHIPQSPF